jgi:hypothetical protein
MKYCLRHVSGKWYGRDASGAFCRTADPNEIYFWATLEEAETNRAFQAECGYFHTIEAHAA